MGYELYLYQLDQHSFATIVVLYSLDSIFIKHSLHIFYYYLLTCHKRMSMIFTFSSENVTYGKYSLRHINELYANTHSLKKG